MYQRVVAEDAPELALVLDAKQESIQCLNEQKQAHKAQGSALSEIQI